MLPQFRGDLKASREEQQGVVFYRIDDPQTQTSFRLYEIEFLIAKKLDGTRSLNQVISAVKAEYNFDISEPDLKKFVSQLESMGFIQSRNGGVPTAPPVPPAAAKAAPAPDDAAPIELEEITAEVDTDVVKAAAAQSAVLDESIFEGETVDEGGFDDPTTREIAKPTQEAALAESAGGDPVRRSTTNPEEVDRMIRTAFEHLKQGYVVHARDYFLAAQESRPSDERLTQIANHVQMIEDEPDEATLQGLWQAAAVLFPDVADDVGMPVVGEVRAKKAGSEDLRSRLLWSAVLLVVVGVGVAALAWVMKAARLFEGTAQVQTAPLQSDRIPVYYAETAVSVGPLREEWLRLDGRGKVTQVAEAGAKVAEGEILVMLQINPKVQRKIEQARGQIDKMRTQYDAAVASLEEVLREREKAQAERDDAEAKLKELRPKSILKSGGVSKRDLEKYKRIVVKSNKQLSKLAKRERKPRAAERKAKQKVEQARQKLAGIEKRLTGKLLKAPFAGVVVEAKVAPGDTVNPDADLVLLRDPLAARVAFRVASAGDLQPGGEAYVSVQEGAPSSAKVLAVEEVEGGVQLEVKLTDPAGTFAEMPPTAFRLVREFAEPAFAVDTSAVIEDAAGGGQWVYVAVGGRAVRRDVEVMERTPLKSVVRSPNGNLRDGDLVVVSYPAEGAVSALLEDAPIEVTGTE